MARAFARFRHVAALVPLLVAVSLLLPGLSGVAAAGTPGSAGLAASRDHLVAGGSVRLTGAVTSSQDACVSGREVRLQQREAGASTWTLLATSVTGADGSFGFYRRPSHTSAFRAFLPVAGQPGISCDAVTSPASRVVVAARVDLSLAPDPLDAGACAKASVVVFPAKPATEVRVQQLRAGAWRTLVTLSLDEASRAAAPLCFGWSGIGTHEVRATWPGGDTLNEPGLSQTRHLHVVKAPWMRKIDDLTAGRAFSVSVASDGGFLYERADGMPRTPASNQKLLLTMALLAAFGPDLRIPTTAAAGDVQNGVVHGGLWLFGRGDPEVGKARIGLLANRIAAAGIRRVDGRVMGSRDYFAHDWWAQGWKPEFPEEEVALPSALTYHHNKVNGDPVVDPERRAAAALTRALEARGIEVARDAGSGTPPGGLRAVASVRSPRLERLLVRMDWDSVNFDAEVLGKLLGVKRFGTPGTIANGAAAIRAFARAHGVSMLAFDSSGLSYDNRVTARGIVRLLGVAESSPWLEALQTALPEPGEGTLEERLAGVPMMAKTGTLEDISALSGWVYLERTGRWARFSMMSSGFSPSREKDIEDAIVRTLWHYGR